MRSEKRLYLSGPMRGLPGLNYDTFNAVAATLRCHDYVVFNPAEHDVGSVERCFQVDFHEITKGCGRNHTGCPYYDGIAVLPGWVDSDGARAEVKVGMLMGMPIYDALALRDTTPDMDLSHAQLCRAHLESVCAWVNEDERLARMNEGVWDVEEATPVSYAELCGTSSLPSSPGARKKLPICTGVLDYFPDALAAVAEVSRIGNEQHNPGQPLHWSREKSADHPDCLIRHLIDRGKRDSDGARHSAKAAWRALAILQLEIEAEREARGEEAGLLKACVLV